MSATVSTCSRLAGDYQGSYKARQAKFCEPNTGKAYHGHPCVPKMTIFEFGMSTGTVNGAEHNYLTGNKGNGDLGTDANFQFEWLKPEARNAWSRRLLARIAHPVRLRVSPGATPPPFFQQPDSTLRDVQQMLTTKFIAIGVTDELSAFELMLTKIFGRSQSAALDKIEESAQNHFKGTEHDTLEELFTEDEYNQLARR